MNIPKLLKKLKVYVASILATIGFLLLFKSIVRKEINSSNVDYTIRDYAVRTLNQMNYGLWSKNILLEKDLFSKTSGQANFLLKGDEYKLEHSLFQKGFDYLDVNLHERVEVSATSASFQLEKGHFDIKKQAILFPVQTAKVRSMKADDYFEIKQCSIQAQISLIWSVTRRRYQETLNLQSSDCLELSVTVKGNLLSESLKRSQVMLHSLFSVAIVAMLVLSVVMLDRQLQGDVSANQQMSMTTVLMLGTMQLVLGFEQIVFALFDLPCFLLIVVVSILYFNLFFFLIFKTIASAVRYQMLFHMQNDQNFNLRSFILFVYFKAHFVILVTFLISLKLLDSPLLFFLWAFALLPQIVKNARSKTRFLASQHCISVYFFLTLLYALYMHFFRFSFFSVNTKTATFTSANALRIVVIALSQVLVLILQETVHPRFFLPRRWRVFGDFDYFFGLDQLRKGKWAHKRQEQCIICFNHLDGQCQSEQKADSDAEPCELSCVENDIESGLKIEENVNEVVHLGVGSDSEESVADWSGAVKNQALKEFLETRQEANKFMGTPCGHVFHTSCLLVWMSQKMDCPVCRAKLPSII